MMLIQPHVDFISSAHRSLEVRSVVIKDPTPCLRSVPSKSDSGRNSMLRRKGTREVLQSSCSSHCFCLLDRTILTGCDYLTIASQPCSACPVSRWGSQLCAGCIFTRFSSTDNSAVLLTEDVKTLAHWLRGKRRM